MSSFRTDLTVDEAALDRDLDRWVSDVLRAGTASVRSTTRLLEKSLEGTTRTLVKGRLWRAWKSEAYPTADIPAYTPQGMVYVNGSGPRSIGAMQYWTQPGVNKPKSGRWLAVPLPSAFGGRRPRDMTPGLWERQNGMRLRFVYRGSTKPALLVADAATNRFGHMVKFSAAKARGQEHRQTTFPVFALIPEQRFANRVAIEPLVRRHEAILAQDFEKRVAALERVK